MKVALRIICSMIVLIAAIGGVEVTLKGNPAVAGDRGVGAPAPAGDRGSAKPIDTISDVPRSARLAMFKAQQKRDAGDIAGSVQVLLDFLNEKPADDHFLLRFQLANSLAQLDRSEEALEHYRAAVRLEERFGQGWLNLGETAYGLGEYGLAAEAILKGYEHGEDKQPRLLYYAAVSHVMDGKADRAVPLLEKIVSGSHGEPQLDWYRALISACLDLKDAERGRRAVSGMIRQFSADPDAWLLAFQFAAAGGDYRQAAVALTVVGYLRPLSREERLMLGDIYNALDIPAEASAHYEQAIGEEGSAQEYERLASAYLASYDFEAARKTLLRAIEAAPTVRLWSLLGDLYYMQKNYERAYHAFEQCAALDPEFGRAYLMMGYCALELGNVGEAVPKLQLAADFPQQEKTARELLKRATVMDN